MNRQLWFEVESSSRTTSVRWAIVVGGFIAGTLDIGVAAAINAMDPRVILRIVAGGIQGRAALQGGAASAWLGLVLQWAMSMVIAGIFLYAASRMRWMIARWAVAGLAYGAIVFLVMNYVVLPSSAWHRVSHFSPASFVENLLAMLLFGLIIAAATRFFIGGSRRDRHGQQRSLADHRSHN